MKCRRTHERLDLATFPPPKIDGQRSVAWRIAWTLVSALAFRSKLPWLPYRAKAMLLRIFGAEVGARLVIKPAVTIKYPWLLKIGDSVWIGEAVWIDNPALVSIGSNACISQGAYLVTGNHDFKSSSFDFFARPIVIADRCWVCAKAILKPGARLEPGTIVPLGSVWPDGAEKTNMREG